MQSAVTVDSANCKGEIPSIQESIQYLDSADELFIQGVIDQYTVYSEFCVSKTADRADVMYLAKNAEN